MVKGELTVKAAPCPSSPCPTAHLRPGRPGSLPGGKMHLLGARSGAAGECSGPPGAQAAGSALVSLSPNWQEIPESVKSFGGAARTSAIWPGAQERCSGPPTPHPPTLVDSAGDLYLVSNMDPGPQLLPKSSPRQPWFLAGSQLIRPIWP